MTGERDNGERVELLGNNDYRSNEINVKSYEISVILCLF